jgi:hypothetical protein
MLEPDPTYDVDREGLAGRAISRPAWRRCWPVAWAAADNAVQIHGGAIQSDAALRQSTEGRQIASATLSVGVLLAILEAAPEIRVPFRVDSHHSSKLGGKSQGGRRDRNQPHHESPHRECITLDRTRSMVDNGFALE